MGTEKERKIRLIQIRNLIVKYNNINVAKFVLEIQRVFKCTRRTAIDYIKSADYDGKLFKDCVQTKL